MSQWQPTRSTHTPLVPGRRRQHNPSRGILLGLLLAPVVWALVALTVWGARELLG